VSFTYSLTDLNAGSAGVIRTVGSAASRSPLRFARRAGQVAWDMSVSGLLDAILPLKGRILREDAGRAAHIGTSLGVYLHWSPSGIISKMVLRQLADWRAAGFDMVFVSNATVPQPDWDAVADHVLLRLQRQNTGLDFGGWRDGVASAIPRCGIPEELLLVNDSVLGPIHPLEPLVAAWRNGGAGLFGMTESWIGGPHLQSYAVLARGSAVAEMLAHLAAFQDRRSKWAVVRQGELGLSGHMLNTGVRCSALFGYQRLCALTDQPTRDGLGPVFDNPQAMLRHPLNPTHHLWKVAVQDMGFPYFKRELLMRNPGNLPGVETWPSLVPRAEDVALIHDHMAVMRGELGSSRA
jgi:hypothetical protein